MKRPKLTICIITRTDGIYTAVCPYCEVIYFSSKNKNEAIQMAKDGLDSYLTIYPTAFDYIKYTESVEV